MTYRFTEHNKGYKVGRTLQPYRPQFKPIIGLVPQQSTVLDVGCGDGVLGAMLISEKQCNVTGFDLDPAGVAESRRKGMRARVWDANRPFPYKTKQFDIVICNELLELCEHPDYVVSECLRVGRRTIIEFPNFGFIVYRLELLLGRFPYFAMYGHQWWESRKIKFFTYRDFNRLPSMKGRKVTRTIGINWRNRSVSMLGSLWPNLFARSVILEILPS